MSVITNLDKEIFETLVKTSNSWTEVMIYFRDNYGYKSITSNKTAKKRCIKEDISFSHFNQGKTKVELTKTTKYYNSCDLKKRLIKQGLLVEKCSNCGLGNIWQGKPISLQLEHIDGDHYNNEIENLTILCPNCHCQTSTWCGRNATIICKCLDCDKKIKKGSTRCRRCSAIKRHKDIKSNIQQNSEPEPEFEYESESEPEQNKCLDCTKPIYKTSKRCISCAGKKFIVRKVPNRPSLEQLENDLEELKTMVAVGKRYGVSDNCIRKWIKNYST